MKKLLILFFCYCNVGIAQINFASQNSFDIVTWNLEWFPKQGTITVDTVKNIIEVIDAELIALQEINNVFEFNQLVNNLDEFDGYSTNSSNLNLGYIFKKNLNIDSIYTILSSEIYFFAGRLPLVLEMNFQGEDYVFINNHLKCCGDGILDLSDSSDEEYRRFYAMNLLKNFIDLNYANKNVVVLGDLNDLIEESYTNNVFTSIIDDSTNYLFADKYIPFQNSDDWSYPSWPSHLDHIIINSNLFDNLDDIFLHVKTLRVDNYIGSFQIYDNIISDHLPVGINLFNNVTGLNQNIKKVQKNRVFNIFGQFSSKKKNVLLIESNDDGTISKRLIID